MIANRMRMDSVKASVEKVTLLPRFADWRDGKGPLELAYRVQVSIPVPVGNGISEEVRGDVWVPVDISRHPVTGEEQVPGLGIESGTPMIPTADALGADVRIEAGSVALKDGVPVLAGRDSDKSHWACARLVPVRARSLLVLTGAVLTPRVYTEGDLKGAPKVTQNGQQIVGVSFDDWEAQAGAGVRKAGGDARGGYAEKAAHVPQWAQDRAAERAAAIV